MQCRRKMTVGSFRPVAALAGDTDTALSVEFQKGCGQQLRVPRGRGKITVTCRSCGASFQEKS